MMSLYLSLCQYFKAQCFNQAILYANTAGIAQVVVYYNPTFVYRNGPGLMGTAPLAGPTPGVAFFFPYQFIILVCHLDILSNVLIVLC